jgi:hypothetical protein
LFFFLIKKMQHIWRMYVAHPYRRMQLCDFRKKNGNRDHHDEQGKPDSDKCHIFIVECRTLT